MSFQLDANSVSDLRLVRAISWAGYALLVFEFFDTLFDEIEFIWPTRVSTVKIIFLANRYGNLAALMLANLQTAGIWQGSGPDFCLSVVTFITVMNYVSFASIHLLLLLRAWAVCERKRRILVILVSLFTVYAVSTLVILIWGFMSIDNVPADPVDPDFDPLVMLQGTCVSPIPNYLWSIWLPGLLLETTIFCLTIATLRHHDLRWRFLTNKPIVYTLYRDGTVYFVVAMFSSLFNIFVWVCYADSVKNMLSNTFTLSLINVVGQRLVLDLRKIDDTEEVSTTHIGRVIEAVPSRPLSPMSFGLRPYRVRDNSIEWLEPSGPPVEADGMMEMVLMPMDRTKRIGDRDESEPLDIP
ncbi:hypothetical protein OBBRIDRAFT_123301 [Obba rivulosa]|uniref:DUF6533 domain-containing protein n=1 Tax=Obba rivulosa TaxID=1052685 RepID=A0A8E2DRL8_9APHY|nr:hypothetical protein OBBRIDRAFT_123301 [Obba rivulosa]